MINRKKLEEFKEPGKVKTVDTPPFNTGNRLISDGSGVYFLDGGRHTVSLK